jgi:hypothetical protein
MTLLQNDSSSESSGKLRGLVIALAVAIVLATTLWLVAHRPPVLEGKVTRLWIHPMHTVLTRKDASGVVQAPETFNQVLVLAQIHLHNRSKHAVILSHLLTNLKMPDGEDSGYAATATDYDRIFVAYPELAGLRTRALVPDTVIAPQGSLDGMIVSSFQLSADQWKQQRGMNFEVDLKMHPALILKPTVAPIIQ